MEKKSDDNTIRINIRDSWSVSYSYGGGQIIYRPRINEVLNSFNYFLNSYGSVFNQFDCQEELINSLFQEASHEHELERNHNVVIDVDNNRYGDTEKTFTNCCICSDDYKEEDIVSNLSCNHVFHKDCILEWGYYNPVCPVCKATIKTK